MPKFRILRQESGQQYTTYEVEAFDKEEAACLMFDGDATIVSQNFKQRDAEVLSIKEI